MTEPLGGRKERLSSLEEVVPVWQKWEPGHPGDRALQALCEEGVSAAAAAASLVAQRAPEGLWYAGSGGNRQEMFVIRGFPSPGLPAFQSQLRIRFTAELQPCPAFVSQRGPAGWGPGT